MQPLLPKKQQGDFQNNAMFVLSAYGGRLKGWGNNSTSVLSNGNTQGWNFLAQEPIFDPNTAMPPTGAYILDWAFTNANLYVVYSNGWVYSAGANDYGQLGHGDTVRRPYLKRIDYFVQNGIQIYRVSAAGSTSLSSGGGCVYFAQSFSTYSLYAPNAYGLYACGANAAGNLGNASTPTTDVRTPAPCAGTLGVFISGVVTISAVGGNLSAYIVQGSALLVAGYNAYGQLGVGNTTNVTGGFIYPTIFFAPLSLSVTAGSALAIDGVGNLWTVGYNGYGQLGLGDTTERHTFTQIPGLSVSVTNGLAGIGGGTVGYAYAINASGVLYTWGYNGQNNLFKNNTTSPVTSPSTTVFPAGQIVNLFFPRSDQLGGSSQLFALTSDNKIIYAGVDNGQQGVPSTTGGYKIIPTPQFDAIWDVFVHGSGGNQRLFIVATAGLLTFQAANVYACGYNQDCICFGGFSSNNMPSYVDGTLVPLGSNSSAWF